MKSKNLMIGLIAFVFAIASAFVTPKFAPQSIWIKAKLTVSSPLSCYKTISTCESSGAFTCNVSTASEEEGGAWIVPGRSGTSCASVLRHNQQQPVATALEEGVIPYHIE